MTIEMPHANFGACITICTIHPKNACYLLHYKKIVSSTGISLSSRSLQDLTTSIPPRDVIKVGNNVAYFQVVGHNSMPVHSS